MEWFIMHKLTLWIVLVLLLSACAPLVDVAQTAIAEAQTAMPATLQPFQPTPTLTAVPASTQSLKIDNIDCIPDNLKQTGKVVDIVDGDTIKVLLDQDGQTYTVRYIGVDTPENTNKVEYFGAESTAKNRELVFGKSVTLIKDVSKTDRYRRLLRFVLTGDLFVNYELVAQGYATASDFPPDISCSVLFHDAERNARSQSLGLWATQNETAQPSASTTVAIVSVNKQAEYVDIKNETGTPIDLAGWELVSERGDQGCTLSGAIQPGEMLRIWADKGQTGFSCGLSVNIWSNSEPDPAVLYNPQGQEVSRYP
jgi:endonuclease YncB( thermonuclease family)